MNDYTIAFFDYMQRGGDVLWGILALTIILWWFVLERGWYFFSGFAEDRDTRLQQWLDRPERSSWYANYERDRLISELECLMMKNMQEMMGHVCEENAGRRKSAGEKSEKPISIRTYVRI